MVYSHYTYKDRRMNGVFIPWIKWRINSNIQERDPKFLNIHSNLEPFQISDLNLKFYSLKPRLNEQAVSWSFWNPLSKRQHFSYANVFTFEES